jgi:hypothetical protein
MKDLRNQQTPVHSARGVATSSSDAQVAETFATMRKCIVIFGVIGAVVLATVAVIALTHGRVNGFMWVRASVLLLATPLFSRWAARGANGQRKPFERLRLVTAVLPVAIVVVDLIPGVCPLWYAGMQALSAVPLVAVAALSRRRVVKASFPQQV